MAEQALYRRLAVFVGGCTLEAAEAVIGVDEAGAGLGVVDGIASLVDKSLLRRDEGGDAEPRFRMLETIREYALERLVEAGESDRFHRRHADSCLTLAEQAEPGLIGPRQAAWLDRLEEDHDNLRAALSWLARHGLAEHALRLGAALRRFWRARGYITEGRERMSALLSLPGAQGRTASRAKALHAAGWLAREQGDYGDARGLFEESLDIYRGLDDTRGIGWALVDLGFLTRYQGDYVAARSLLEESLGLLKRVGDTEGMRPRSATWGSSPATRATRTGPRRAWRRASPSGGSWAIGWGSAGRSPRWAWWRGSRGGSTWRGPVSRKAWRCGANSGTGRTPPMCWPRWPGWPATRASTTWRERA